MSSKALVVGSAMCVWEDLISAGLLDRDWAVVVVNDMIPQYEDPIRYAVTLHHEKLLGWQNERKKNGYNQDYISVSHERPDAWETPNHPRIDKIIDYRYGGMTASGSSGLFAVKVALDEGFDRVVLAGVPMLRSGKHFNNDSPWDERDSFVEAWKVALPHIQGKVKSLSGWTRELLGSPTLTWLRGAQE